MVHGISAHGGPEWSHRSQSPRVTARAASLDAEVSHSGALQVTTDDGDTVTISFAALERLHAESFRGKAGGARVAYGSSSDTNNVSVDISVEGALDEKETADISELLGQLSGAILDPTAAPAASQLDDGGALDSLSSFQLAYQEQSRVEYNSARVRITA